MKSTEVIIAEQNVDASIAQFETAVNHLIAKVEGTASKVNDVIDQAKVTYENAVDTFEETKERIMQPVNVARDIAGRAGELSRDLADRANVVSRDVADRIRRDPETFVSWAVLAFGFFLCYRAIRSHNRALSNRHSWSQLEP